MKLIIKGEAVEQSKLTEEMRQECMTNDATMGYNHLRARLEIIFEMLQGMIRPKEASLANEYEKIWNEIDPPDQHKFTKPERVLGYECDHCRKPAFYLKEMPDINNTNMLDIIFYAPGKKQPNCISQLVCQWCGLFPSLHKGHGLLLTNVKEFENKDYGTEAGK